MKKYLDESEKIKKNVLIVKKHQHYWYEDYYILDETN